MARKRIKVQPSKGQSKITFFIGIIFCIIGIFVVIPSTGLFGIVWTGMAVVITYTNYRNGFTDEPIPTQEIIVDDSTFTHVSESNDIENRLRKLESLYQQGLITRDEYDDKRKELIDKL